jgi:hypothetical protein
MRAAEGAIAITITAPDRRITSEAIVMMRQEKYVAYWVMV